MAHPQGWICQDCWGWYPTEMACRGHVCDPSFYHTNPAYLDETNPD